MTRMNHLARRPLPHMTAEAVPAGPAMAAAETFSSSTEIRPMARASHTHAAIQARLASALARGGRHWSVIAGAD